MELIVGQITINCDFPGGNIHVFAVDGSHFWLGPDQRDTNPEGPWFYWCFQTRGQGGQELTFHFQDSSLIGTRGPAVSYDGGKHWLWLGRTCLDGAAFTCRIPNDADSIHLALAMPYTGAQLEDFLREFTEHLHLERGQLCLSQQGRSVEKLRVGRLDGGAPFCLVLTARHHACECMASYELEGLIAAMLGDDDLGRWFQQHVQALVIPFVDRDGVENGDQGKNRIPHDHNRDYFDFLYPETRAIRSQIFPWSKGRPLIALDLHCPLLRDRFNESVSILGGPDPGLWAEIEQLSACLETVQSGVLRYRAADNMPFGTDWNMGFDLEMKCFHGWVGRLPGVRLAGAVELPYATANGQEVNPTTARAFGRDIAAAIRAYLEN